MCSSQCGLGVSNLQLRDNWLKQNHCLQRIPCQKARQIWKYSFDTQWQIFYGYKQGLWELPGLCVGGEVTQSWIKGWADTWKSEEVRMNGDHLCPCLAAFPLTSSLILLSNLFYLFYSLILVKTYLISIHLLIHPSTHLSIQPGT